MAMGRHFEQPNAPKPNPGDFIKLVIGLVIVLGISGAVIFWLMKQFLA